MPFYYSYRPRIVGQEVEYDFDPSYIKGPKYDNLRQVVFKSEDSITETEGLFEIAEDEYENFSGDNEEVIAYPVTVPEIDLLGQQLVEKELQILELQQENQVLGQQMVDIDLRLLMGGL